MTRTTAADADADARRNRLVLTVAPAVLLVVALGLLAIGADALGVLGVLLLAAAMALLALDGWSTLPRPRPRHASGGTLLRQSPTAGCAALLAALGLALGLASLALGDGLLEVAGERRSGPLLLLGAVLAPLFLAGALALVLRPDRVLLTPREVDVRRLGRSRRVGWEQLLAVSATGGPADVVVLHTVEGDEVSTPTRFLGLRGPALRLALVACRNDPALRADLDSPAGPERVTRAGADPTTGGQAR